MIDTLEKIRPKTDVRKGVYDADYEALEPLLPLAADFGIAVVIVHDTRKTPGANPLEEVSGSYGLSGGIDGVLVMRRERGSRDAALHVTGRDVEEGHTVQDLLDLTLADALHPNVKKRLAPIAQILQTYCRLAELELAAGGRPRFSEPGEYGLPEETADKAREWAGKEGERAAFMRASVRSTGTRWERWRL